MEQIDQENQEDQQTNQRIQKQAEGRAYWNASIRIVLGILCVWFFASYICGIIYRDYFDTHFPSIGGAPFGFWMSQQGSIIVFLVLLVVYKVLMDRLDTKHQFDKEDDA